MKYRILKEEKTTPIGVDTRYIIQRNYFNKFVSVDLSEVLKPFFIAVMLTVAGIFCSGNKAISAGCLVASIILYTVTICNIFFAKTYFFSLRSAEKYIEDKAKKENNKNFKSKKIQTIIKDYMIEDDSVSIER